MFQQCDALTKKGQRCVNNSKHCSENKHYCGIHAKQLFPEKKLPLNTTECVVCYNDVPNKKAERTVCNHVFCKKCLGKWLRLNHTCPLCRTQLREPTRVLSEDDLEALANEFIMDLVRNNQISLLDDNNLYITIEINPNDYVLLEQWNNHVHNVDQIVHLL